MEELLKQYKEAKLTLDKYKSLVDDLGAEIKQQMKAIDEKQKIVDGYKFEYVVQNRKSFKEEPAIKYLSKFPECLDQKPVINENKVAEYVEKGIIPLEEFEKFIEVKQIEMVRMTKVKKGE